MTATRQEQMTLRSLVTIHRHEAAAATERLALCMEDSGPCTANDLAHELNQLERIRFASALALQAECMERQSVDSLTAGDLDEV